MEPLTALTAAIPLISELALAIAVPIFAVYFSRWTGIQIEEKDQRAIHSALKSGATAAVKAGPAAGFLAVKDAALSHLYSSVPDAVSRIPQAQTSVLETIAERYAADAISALKK